MSWQIGKWAHIRTSTKKGQTNVTGTPAKSQSFFHPYRIDQDLAESVKAKKCRFCQSRLDSANYLRKPRGGPADIDEAHLVRFSLCCSRKIDIVPGCHAAYELFDTQGRKP